MSNPIQSTGLPDLVKQVQKIQAKYGVKRNQDLPPAGADEVRAALAHWQQTHKPSGLASFLDKVVKPLGLGAFEKMAGALFGPAASTAAHTLVDRAQTGDWHAKQAIGHALSQAAAGNPIAQKAVRALAVAKQQIKTFGPQTAECLAAQASFAGVGCASPRGTWTMSAGGGQVFIPAAYLSTSLGRLMAAAGARRIAGTFPILSPAAHRARMAALRRAGVRTRTVHLPGADVVLRAAGAGGLELVTAGHLELVTAGAVRRARPLTFREALRAELVTS